MGTTHGEYDNFFMESIKVIWLLSHGGTHTNQPRKAYQTLNNSAGKENYH